MIKYIIPFLLHKVNYQGYNYFNRVNSVMIISNFDYNLYWEKINYNQDIDLKHFDNILSEKKEYDMELLKINGIPALIIIIDKNEYNDYYVREFVFNKSLILMLDAGSSIRISFYKRFRNIDFKNALNKNIFIII